MMATVKDFVSSIGNIDLVRRFGGGGSHRAKKARGAAAQLAKQAGGSAAGLARRIGPKRGLIGLAAVGAAVGTVYLVRYLRANRAEGDEGIVDASDGTTASRRPGKQTRAERKAANAAMTH